jgi:uncharacterized membrane protein
MPGFGEFFGLIAIVVPILITLFVVGTIMWILWRGTRREGPAVAELRARYVRGEIDPAEFEVRLRSLTRSADSA